MKYIIPILVLFSLLSFTLFYGVIKLENGATIYNTQTDTLYLKETNVKIKGSIEITNDVHFEMPHGFFSKRDTLGYNQSVAQNYYTKFTGLSTVESHEVSYLAGDTIKYTGHDTAHANIMITLNGTTTNANDDIWIRVVNLRSGYIAYSMATSRGSNNYNTWVILGYDNQVVPNDKYLFQITNKTNGNDMTVYSVTVEFLVKHFE